jgi:hypothetical protein
MSYSFKSVHSRSSVSRSYCIFGSIVNTINMNTINGENSRERSRIYREQIVTVEDLNTLKSDLLNEIKKLLCQDSDTPGKKWLRSSEVRKMLGISNGTLQNFRVNGVVPFTKVGGIMFYSQEDIEKLLQENSTSRGNG